MPKRGFGEFITHTNPGTLAFQTAPLKMPFARGRQFPHRRKQMMTAIVKPVTHRGVRGRATSMGVNGPRRIFKAQGVGPRTGGFTGIERKFYDTSLVASALTAPTDSSGGEHDQSATICLNSVIQGDGESNRDGRKATFQSCFVKGLCTVAAQANNTAGLGGTKIYIALVLDTQTNGAQLNSEDVFKNDSGSGSMAASPMRNMQFTQRFRILDTAEFIMQDPNISYDGTNIEMNGVMQEWQLSSNLTFSTTYSGTTETVANITDNSVHIVAYCNALGLVPQISYNARVRFVG